MERHPARKAIVGYAFVIVSISFALAASATVRYVDLKSTNPTSPFTDWSTAAANIQDAVDAASPGDQVLVTNGVYQTGALSVDGITTNRVVINQAVTVQSVNGPAVTMIDGGHAVRCAYMTNGASLNGFTLTNGVTSGNGGGIFCASPNESVTNCVIVSNIALGNAGGVSGGSLLGCFVASNIGSNNAGGVLMATLSHCVVSNNAVPLTAIAGGGLYSCVASDCTICQNSAEYGGGAESCTLTRCVLTGNYAAVGGGAENSTLNFCILLTNGLSTYGGGASVCSLNNCVIFGNLAAYGGGAYYSFLKNCTVVQNVAYLSGGGVNSGGGNVTAVNCIIYDNSRGPAYYDIGDNYSSGTFSNCCTWPLPLDGTGNFTNAPLFVNEATDNLRLQTNSPCINMGDNLSVTAAVDLDGNPRIYQSVVDMGAYECQVPVTLGAGIVAAFTNSAVGFPLSFSGLVTRGISLGTYWDFGDGTIVSNQLSISHTWTTAGDYNVSFHAFNEATPSGAIATVSIHVIALTVQPASQSATIGNDATFQVFPGPLQPQSYQWYFNGNIDGATNASLTLSSVQPGQAGTYFVIIKSPAGYPPATIANPGALTVNPAVCAPSPSGLVAWWRLEGNALDEIGTNNGVTQNGVGFTPGKVGQAASFDGSIGYISVASNPVLKPATAFTLEAWINCSQFTGSNGATIAMKGPDAEVPGDWALLIDPAWKLRPEVNVNGNWISFECNSVLNPGVWYHVALVYDGSVLKGYVNGVNDGIHSAPGMLQTSDNPLKIGTQTSTNPPTQTSYFPGQIDEVSFYDRALTDSEISAVFNAGSAGKCDAPSAPSFVTQPMSVSVLPGTTATFSCVAGGTPPLSYQWYVNQSPIAGETNSALVLDNIGYGQSGNVYSVAVTNVAGGVVSTNAPLTVIDTPPHISSIGTQHVLVNSNTPPISFTVSDAESPADQLTVVASSANTNLAPASQIILGGSGTNRTVTIFPRANQIGNTVVTLTVIDPGGMSNQTSFTLVIDQFAQIAALGLTNLVYSAAAWGDYDNDGKLDLLVTGTTNGVFDRANGAVTRIYHNDGGVFTNFISLPGVYKGAVAWCDYDRDGFLDFAISGLNTSNLPVTMIYHNNGDGTFTNVTANLVGVSSGSLAWGDFNNDGAPDLLVCGLTNITKLYRNNGDGTFTDTHANLPGISFGSAVWGDFDNNGTADLLLVGLQLLYPQAIVTNQIADIYRNLGNGVFTNSSHFSQSLSLNGNYAVAGDVNNDGWLDVIICGNSTYAYTNNQNGTFTHAASLSASTGSSATLGDLENDGYLDLVVAANPSQFYHNNNDGTFTGILANLNSLPRAGFDSVAAGDFNNDGRLDLVFAGASDATLWQNDNVIADTPPVAPANLAAVNLQSNGIILTWSPSVDSQTASNGVTYNLRVGTKSGGVDTVPPLADPVTGQRRAAAQGNAGLTNQALLIDLAQGTYYWAVQAIDNAFEGSPFSAEGSFVITNSRPTISTIPDQSIAPLSPLTIPFSIGDADTPISQLVLAVQSSNTNVVPLTNIVLSVPNPAFPSNYVAQITAVSNGTSVVTITVTDPQGAFASALFGLTGAQFSLLSNNFIPLQRAFIACGDFDNDGNLDVLVGGVTNNNPNFPVTQLYHNLGGGVFAPFSTTLPNVGFGSAAWGDFDNSGNLGLVLTGTTNGNATGAITRIYRNTGGAFTEIGAGLPGVYQSAVAWGDFDNDGRLDLLVTGTTNGSGNGAIVQLYRNMGNGTFSNAFTFPGVFESAVAFADFDGDGFQDVLIAGQDATGASTAMIYKNNGDKSFTLVTNLTGAFTCSVSIGDFDNDGRPDVIIAGFSTSNSRILTQVYHNNGNFNFTDIGASLPGVDFGSVAWGDFDNDGLLDILICGTSNNGNSGALTRVYRNTGSSSLSQAFTNFTLYSSALPTNYFGAAAWGDFENRGVLDVLVAGSNPSLLSQTLLYRNNCAISNLPPSAPTGLTFTRSNATVMLAWNPSSDLQTTNADGLKYQVRIGSTPVGIDIKSPAADAVTGQRRSVQACDAFSTQWPIVDLPPGTYYWSVQAVDTGLAGSPFAAESTFTVLPPPIAIPDAISTQTNTPIAFAATNLTTNDIDLSELPLTVIAVGTNSASGGTVSLAGGTVTYAPLLNFTGNDTFWYSISDGQSASAVGTVTVTVGTGGMVWLRALSGPLVQNGDFALSLEGVPGLTYTIEDASTVTGPWEKITNVQAPLTDQGFGVGGFKITVLINDSTNRYYRIIYPAY